MKEKFDLKSGDLCRWVTQKICFLRIKSRRKYRERGRDLELKHLDENGIRRRRRKPTKSVAIRRGL